MFATPPEQNHALFTGLVSNSDVLASWAIRHNQWDGPLLT